MKKALFLTLLLSIFVAGCASGDEGSEPKVPADAPKTSDGAEKGASTPGSGAAPTPGQGPSPVTISND